MRPSGAETRFNNDRVRASQQSMGTNMAARNALKASYAPKPTGKRSPVGLQNGQTAPTGMGKPPLASVPQRPQAAPPGPQGNVETPLSSLLQQVSLDKLISSSEVHDAFVKVKLRDKYNGRDSGDDVGRQVLDILTAPLTRVG